jgi:hypothetical protein
MHPKVATIDLETLAKRNITDLAAIESEIFAWTPGPQGTIVPKNKQYWDIGSDGSTLVDVRIH